MVTFADCPQWNLCILRHHHAQPSLQVSHCISGYVSPYSRHTSICRRGITNLGPWISTTSVILRGAFIMPLLTVASIPLTFSKALQVWLGWSPFPYFHWCHVLKAHERPTAVTHLQNIRFYVVGTFHKQNNHIRGKAQSLKKRWLPLCFIRLNCMAFMEAKFP